MEPIALKKTSQAMTKKWMNNEELSEFYSEWHDYDKHYKNVYNGPRQCAKIVDQHFTGDRETAKVLDVAAGTGLVAQQMQNKGFMNIDGIEPSKGMARQALEKGLYRNMYYDYFNEDVKCLKTDTYDILVMVGALGEKHFQINALPEVIRCVKPGGLVVIVGRHEYVTKIEAYRDKLEPAFEELEAKGQWMKLERDIFQEYFSHHDGVAYVYKVTKN